MAKTNQEAVTTFGEVFADSLTHGMSLLKQRSRNVPIMLITNRSYVNC